MALEIGAFVLGGQVDNSRRNSVFGFLQLAEDYYLHLQLTGNAEPPLAGQGVQFSVFAEGETATTPHPEAASLPEDILALSRRQAGVCSSLQVEYLSEGSDEVFLRMDWFSQNGPVSMNLRARLVTLPDDGDGSDDVEALSEIDFEETDPSLSDMDDDEEDSDDPFGLFGKELMDQINPSGGDASDGDPANDSSSPGKDSWIEGPWSEGPWGDGVEDWQNQEDMDPETRALHAQWDEIFSGKKDQPLPYLFEKTLRLPRPDAVETDEEAWPLVVAILEQLARLSFVLDVCEHYTPLQTYRLLMEEVLQNAQVHPNLAASEIVQHYSTSDYCAECEAEFDIDVDDTLDPE